MQKLWQVYGHYTVEAFADGPNKKSVANMLRYNEHLFPVPSNPFRVSEKSLENIIMIMKYVYMRSWCDIHVCGQC